MPSGEESWSEYRRLVISELERANSGIAALNLRVDVLRDEFRRDLLTLKLKAAAWGGAAGAVPVVFGILYEVLKRP